MTSILAARERAARRRQAPTQTLQEAITTPLSGNEQRADWLTQTIDKEGLSEHRSSPLGRRLLAKALTIRQTEERLLQLFAEGKLSGTVHTCIGQEWVGVAVAETLRAGDYVFSNHRGHGHYLACTDDVDGLIAELMGRSTGVCGGRGGSQHLCRNGFFSNGIQGGIVPVAAGLAMARRIEDGSNIAVVFIGDGTLGQGVLYETLNMAAKWSLPLLIVVEDNGIAQSTPQNDTLAGTIKGRAHAFGIDVRQADTWNPIELIAQASQATRTIRQTRKPLLLHVKTYRLRAHSKGDDNRDTEEVACFEERDLLNRIIAANEPETQSLITAIDRRLDTAIEHALTAPITTITETNPTPPKDTNTDVTWKPATFEARRVVEAIRDSIHQAMSTNERIILLGEDLNDPYGGAFKVTAGLSTAFSDRVYSTPISEAGIVGIGNGLALAGMQPVVEIMFGDFLMLAADQFINHAAKFAWMYNEQVSVPIVIRTPMGGYRGYGPTHSQCLEKHLLGLPGTRVLALHKRYCPGQLYQTLLANNDRPTLIIENKLLYSQRTDPIAPPGYHLAVTDAPFPTIRLAPNQPCQVTIVTYGGLVEMTESAIAKLHDEEDLSCELLIPTQLYPLDIEPIVESILRTGRLLVVEEGQAFAGFGSELIAQLAADTRVPSFQANRINAQADPIPAAKTAENIALPNQDDIIQGVIQLVTDSM